MPGLRHVLSALCALLLSAAVGEAAMIVNATLDVRTWQPHEDELLRIATWTVVFDGPIGLMDMETNMTTPVSAIKKRNMTLAGAAGINLLIECEHSFPDMDSPFTLTSQGGSIDEMPVTNLLAFPSTPNAAARFLARLTRSYDLFGKASEVWDDTLIFGQVVGRAYRPQMFSDPYAEEEEEEAESSGLPNCPPPMQAPGLVWEFNAECLAEDCVAVIFNPSEQESPPRYEIVDADTEEYVPIGQTPVEEISLAELCTPEAVQTMLPKLEEALVKLQDARTLAQFVKAQTTLPNVKIMDGFSGCKFLTESMVDFRQEMRIVSSVRVCLEPEFSPGWFEDPCCNEALEFEMCCSESDLAFNITQVGDFNEDVIMASCDPNKENEVMDALDNYKSAINMQNNVAEGCAAVRESQFPKADKKQQKVIDKLYGFYSQCYSTLFGGKTKNGQNTCKKNNQCYTSCNPQSKRCQEPWDNFQEAFVECAIDKMDPVLQNFFRERVEIPTDASNHELVEALFDAYAKPDCAGELADFGTCMIGVGESDCTIAYDNGETVKWIADAPDANYRCLYWRDHMTHPDHAGSMDWHPVHGDPWTACQDIADSIAWDSGATPSALYVHLKNEYEWEIDEETDEESLELVHSGDESYCTMQQRCNHKPWDMFSSSQATCVDQYATDEFCGFCEGETCWEISSPAKCLKRGLNAYYEDISYDRFSCEDAGGYFMPTDAEDPDYCWESNCCLMDNSTYYEADGCLDTDLCKAITDDETGYVEYGFCEWTTVCYDTLNSTECQKLKDASGTEWPQLYSSEENDNQWFTPAEEMCIFGLETLDGEVAGDITDCEANGRMLHTPRAFVEGRWNTKSSCEQGFCSSDPENFELARDPQKCLGNSGECTEDCPRCNRVDDEKPARVCVAPMITNRSSCSLSGMTWHNDTMTCYGSGVAICQRVSGTVSRRCSDLTSMEDCQTGSVHELWPFYQNVLACEWDHYATCLTESDCKDRGVCEDYHYENWIDETKDACRFEFVNGTDWGPDDNECRSYASDPEGFSWEVVWEDACMVYDLTNSECEMKGGTVVAPATNEGDCTDREKCFDLAKGFVTTIEEDQCEDECDPDTFEWRSVHKFRNGQWSTPQMLAGTWTDRSLQSVNKWKDVISDETINIQVWDAILSLMAEAYASETQCLMHPLFSVFEEVACACGASSEDDGYCTDVYGITSESPIGTQCLWKNQNNQIRTAGGQVTIPMSAMNQTNGRCINTTSGYIAGTSQRNAAVVRRRRHEMAISGGRRQAPQPTCADYEVIKNSNNEVVGQLIGNGFTITGIGALGAGKSINVCVPPDSTGSIPLCTHKYPVQDLALGTADKKPGVPLMVAVTNSKGKLCANIMTPAGATTLVVYPIIRTANGGAVTAPPAGIVVTAQLTFSGMSSKDQFTVSRQSSFRTAMAQTLAAQGATGVSATDIVITKICDVGGSCTILVSTRRQGGSGVTVEFRVQVADAASFTATQVSSALQSNSFNNAFSSNMATAGGGTWTVAIDTSTITQQTQGTPAPTSTVATTASPSDPTLSGVGRVSPSLALSFLATLVLLAVGFRV